MRARIIGFDLARAYAIFGMFVVNFNTVFGSHTDHSGLSGFLNLFNGNSSSIFVMLAGMGVSLMSNQDYYTKEEKINLRNKLLKRSWFLFFVGLLFCFWWPADILHFYGGYMHFAAFFLFLPKRYYLFAAVSAVLVFHILLMVLPYETGWDFDSLIYVDFWSFSGFIRNTFYNGWNSIFPWIAYFFLGMYLGRLNWNERHTRHRLLISGIIVYAVTEGIQTYSSLVIHDQSLLFYLTADYLPPFLPFMLATASFGVIVICVFIFIGNRIEHSRMAGVLASTGQMTLTHYLSHLTIGLFLLSLITGKSLSYDLLKETPTRPELILIFSIVYFSLSCTFSYFWSLRFNNGPMEWLMRVLSDVKKDK